MQPSIVKTGKKTSQLKGFKRFVKSKDFISYQRAFVSRQIHKNNSFILFDFREKCFMIVQKWSKNFNPIEKWRKRCFEIFGKCPTEGSNICKVEQIVMNMKKTTIFYFL